MRAHARGAADAPAPGSGSHGVLLVFDLTRKESFTNMRSWVHQLAECSDVDCVKVLVGNKVDMEAKREVAREAAEALAAELGAQYMEVSAKTGDGVNESFDAVAHAIHRAVLDGTIVIPGTVLGDGAAASGTVRLKKQEAAAGKKKCGC